MSSSAVKRKLSGSTDGRAIKVGASPATTIHTAVTGQTAGTFDEVWLWAYNSHTANVVLTIQFGGTSTPDDEIKVTVPYKSGLIPIIPGLLLQNGCIITAYAATADVITLSGFVNSITD